MKRAQAFMVAMIIAGGLTACGNDNTESAKTHNDADVSFAQNMIPHHKQAIEMARAAATKAQDQRVKSIAQRIESAQLPEIQTMQGWLRGWKESEKPTVDHEFHGAALGPGMMSAEEIQKLQFSSGADFDRMFLDLMIRHHEGAIAMAEEELTKGKDAATKDLATRIRDDQRREINEMRAILR